MTNVLVCVKRVPDVSGEVLLADDAQSVDARYVGFTVSAHESCAVELAVQIGQEVTALTVGPAEAVEQLRSALGVGCTAAVLVEADTVGFGPADVAREIAAVVAAHEATGRRHDLILLGNDAADTGDFQVGIRLAHELGRPVVNGVKTVEVADGVVIARGDGPDGGQRHPEGLHAAVGEAFSAYGGAVWATAAQAAQEPTGAAAVTAAGTPRG
ncbi:MAG: hypothetical protein L0I24_03435, partial [Pseudonocardia sp.]|nr:hypothetical protein [Pseudonocardia sp.]